MLGTSRMSPEMWAVLRRRMIQETEEFINDGLAHPERYVYIPRKEVGTGGWSVTFASVFWSQILASS
ncbi:MAG TPA: hypothetical protein PL151_03850 [Phycisphaerae bacterium]|nr:hypothetical protein [Phycisphaerae bacterium]HOJ75472.1 hypothetical protein [Phycisphaerae bacterium]HOM52272.1 hypothetical protein [Phycisphaerae bacterium]HON66276.1 hypothetical protein [Phycisphaerae bacterium]HOQ86926.1 hypothetical protein [Phycisphaerae bacterium]